MTLSKEYLQAIAEMNKRVDKAVEKLHQEHGSQRLQKEEERISTIVTQGHIE